MTKLRDRVTRQDFLEETHGYYWEPLPEPECNDGYWAFTGILRHPEDESIYWRVFRSGKLRMAIYSKSLTEYWGMQPSVTYSITDESEDVLRL